MYKCMGLRVCVCECFCVREFVCGRVPLCEGVCLLCNLMVYALISTSIMCVVWVRVYI